MQSFFSALFRSVLKVVLWGTVIYVIAVLPALVWTHFDPAAEHTERRLLFTLVGVWDAFLLGGGTYIWFLRGSTWRRRRAHAPSGTHGTAHWSDGSALMGPGPGRLVGKVRGRFLHYAGDGHLLTVAPTRSGKGVSAVIPNLLTHPGSVVVTDPKGENYSVTMAYRAADLGQRVAALDPFGMVGGADCYNPLELVDPLSPDAIDDAAMIADMLVVPEDGGQGGGGQTANRFWDDEARALLTGLVLFVAGRPDPRERTLGQVRALLTGSADEWEQALDEMAAKGGLVRRAATRLRQKADRERSGVISSAQNHTHFLDSPRMTRVLARSTVDLTELGRGSLSLYLVLPPDRLDTHRRWLRLTIGCCLHMVTRTPVTRTPVTRTPVARTPAARTPAARTPERPHEKVLFLLDEFANLGPMPPVVRGVSLLAGYGASLWLFLQDLSQLRAVYPDTWGSFLANVDVLQSFGTADQATAELFSRMTGQATVEVESVNRSRGRSVRELALMGQRQEGSGTTISEIARPLLMPDEIRRLDPTCELLFVRGQAPVLADRLDYRRDREFAGRFRPNPRYAGEHDRQQ